MSVASLVPGRVVGFIETDPQRSSGETILLLNQARNPAQLAIPESLPAGVIIVEPAPFSHAVIRWCGRGIPVGMLTAEQASRLKAGDPVVLDTACGTLRAWDRVETVPPWQVPPPPAAGPLLLRDGEAIELRASIGPCPDARRAAQAGAAAIGLVRTEYLVPPAGQRPSIDFYLASFARCLAAAASLPVSFRLLDLAADKWPAWLVADADAAAWRGLHGSQLYTHAAVREGVEAQLRALARLAAADESRRLGVIWPAGSTLAEYQAWLAQQTDTLPHAVARGVMIETPLEALAIDAWLQISDVVALGCNDLLQQLGGARRDDPRLRGLLDPYHPALYRFYREVARQAGADLARVQLCGLLPQIDGVLPLLIGLGYRNFSVEPALIPLLARQARDLDSTSCRQLAAAVCRAPDSAAVRDRLGLAPARLWSLLHDPASDCERTARSGLEPIRPYSAGT